MISWIIGSSSRWKIKLSFIFRAGQIYLYAHDFSGAQNESQLARLIEKQLETIIFVLCYLNRTCSFHLCCNSIKHFWNWTFAVLFECLKYDASQRIICQKYLSKGVQKNTLKAWNFTKYKFCYRSFDNSLQKSFRTNILESNAAQILLTVVLMVGLCLDN